MNIRPVFLDCAARVREMLDEPAVGERWDDPSALDMMSVGDVTAHLTRALTTTATYLGRPVTGRSDDLVTPASYYLAIDLLTSDGPDIEHDLHASVRERARRDAARGHSGVLQAWDDTVDALASRFAIEPPGRQVEVYGGQVMLLDDYLVTRLVELLVHADDLAVSLAIESPPLAAEAYDTVISCLLAVALERHGPLAVVRAMARVERDSVRALRVL